MSGDCVAETQKDRRIQEEKTAEELNKFTDLVISLSIQCDEVQREDLKTARKQHTRMRA